MLLLRPVLIGALLIAGLPAGAQPAPPIVLPDILAVELPAGAAQLMPSNPPLRDVLTAAKSGQRTVTNDLKQPVTMGAVRVTWSAWDGTPGTGKAAATRSGTLFVLPSGITPVGVSGDENATAGNNAVRIVRDRLGRLHMVWADSGRQPDKVGATYRRAVIGADGAVQFETPPTSLADKTPADWNAYPALAVTNDGVIALWQGGGTARVRRLINGSDGYVWGPVRDTGVKSEGRDSGPAIVSDAVGLHFVTPNGFYGFSADGGQTWRQELIPLPARQKIKTVSIAAMPAGGVQVAFSLIVQDIKDTSGKKGSGGYWQLRTIRRMPDGKWVDPQDALAAFPPWQEPKGGQDVLADWVRVAVDGAGGSHLTWHGTAESRIYSNDQAYYAYQPPQAAWQEPVALLPPDAARGVKFSFAPALTLENERAFATVFYDVFDGARWSGFDVDLIPLNKGAIGGPPIPVSRFVRRANADKTPEFALSSRFPAAAAAPYRDSNGRAWLPVLETYIPMGVPDAAKLIVLHRLDVTSAARR